LVLAAAGALAWFGARFVGLVVAGVPTGQALTGVFDGTRPSSYPAVHLAVVAAVILTAAPFLTRPVRRTGQVLLVLFAVSAVVLRVGGPNDVFGALVLAWAVAAALHLVAGSPAGRPTVRQVVASLRELEFEVTSVELAPDQPRGFTRMFVTTPGGEMLPVKVY